MHSDEYDFAAVLERWSTVIRRPDRVHVIAADPARPEEAWHAFGDVTGIDTRSLGLGEPERARGAQCGCQASSSDVRVVTAFGSLPSASCWMDTCSKTSRRECRAAIHTCWRTAAVSV